MVVWIPVNHDPQGMAPGETVHSQFSFLEACQNPGEILRAGRVVCEAAAAAAAAGAVMPG